MSEPGGRLRYRAVIVTGAGAGGGEAIARTFAREGARVTCADLDAEAARRVAEAILGEGGAALAIEMDHSRAEDCLRAVATTVDAFGSLDVLVNNAGVAILGAALDVSEDDFMRQLRINVLGPFLMTRATLPEMVNRRRGSVVMIASAAGLHPRPAGIAYITSKHAVVGMTRSLAIDYAPYGIRVNAVCPGVFQTRIADQYIEDRARLYSSSRDAVLADLGSQYPLGRIGQPDDVADIALHFACDESRWVTGTTYLLDGGQFLLGPQRPVPPRQ